MKHYELSFRVKSHLNSNNILKEYHEHVMHCFCQTQSRTMQRVKGIKLWVSSFRSDLFGTMMWVHNMFEKVPLTCPRALDKIICSLGMFALWITFMWVCWRRRRRWGGVKWYWIIYGCQKTSSNPWTLIPPPQNVLYSIVLISNYSDSRLGFLGVWISTSPQLVLYEQSHRISCKTIPENNSIWNIEDICILLPGMCVTIFL